MFAIGSCIIVCQFSCFIRRQTAVQVWCLQQKLSQSSWLVTNFGLQTVFGSIQHFLHVVLQSRTIHATLWQLFSGNSIYSTSQEYFINSCFHCVFWSQALWRTVSFLFLMLQHSELLATYTNANEVWLTRLLLPVIRLTLHSIKAPLILKHRPSWMGSRVPSLDGFMNSAAYYRSRLSKHTSHPCITITAIQRVTWPG